MFHILIPWSNIVFLEISNLKNELRGTNYYLLLLLRMNDIYL